MAQGMIATQAPQGGPRDRDVPGVRAAIDLLEKEATGYAKLLEELKERVEPVLSPPEPQPGNGDLLRTASRPSCSIAELIRGTADRIGQMNHELHAILRRLDV